MSFFSMLFNSGVDRYTRSNQYPAFEHAFYKEFGRTPSEFITMKLDSGSSTKAVHYLYDILAAEISEKYNVEEAPFQYFCDEWIEDESEGIVKEDCGTKDDYDDEEDCDDENEHDDEEDYDADDEDNEDIEWIYVDVNTIKVCRRELLPHVGGSSFGKTFAKQLNELFKDDKFAEGIRTIAGENSEIEFEKDPMDSDFIEFKRRIIPNEMKKLNLDKIPAFHDICQETKNKGYSINSARITVYYLMRMLDIFEIDEEDRSVKTLAMAINYFDRE